jgi:hypothetical protein
MYPSAISLLSAVHMHAGSRRQSGASMYGPNGFTLLAAVFVYTDSHENDANIHISSADRSRRSSLHMTTYVRPEVDQRLQMNQIILSLLLHIRQARTHAHTHAFTQRLAQFRIRLSLSTYEISCIDSL